MNWAEGMGMINKWRGKGDAWSFFLSSSCLLPMPDPHAEGNGQRLGRGDALSMLPDWERCLAPWNGSYGAWWASFIIEHRLILGSRREPGRSLRLTTMVWGWNSSQNNITVIDPMFTQADYDIFHVIWLTQCVDTNGITLARKVARKKSRVVNLG